MPVGDRDASVERQICNYLSMSNSYHFRGSESNTQVQADYLIHQVKRRTHLRTVSEFCGCGKKKKKKKKKTNHFCWLAI